MTGWFNIHVLSGCRIQGADAAAFCQSQFTADIDSLAPDRWQPAAWCNRKGRVRILILAKRNQDGVELIFPTVQAGLLKELGLFTIGRKVVIGSIEGVSGAYGKDLATPIAGDCFERALRLDSRQSTSPGPASPQFLERWALQDILLPMPWLDERTQDRFLPQALGLEDNGGLSYSKGCYPGQEIVARVHYLGRSPERLAALKLKTPDKLEVGDLLEAEASTPDGGRATIVALAPDKACLLGLAVVPDREGAGDTMTLTLGDTFLRAEVTPPDSLCYYRDQFARESES